MIKIKLLAVCALALLASGLAQASIVAQPPNQSGGSDLNSFLEADDFILSSNAQIVQVKFWAVASSPADFAGSVDWAFYSDLAGAPNVALVSGNAAAIGIATGNTTFGLNEYAYTFSVNVFLGTGTYWMVLHNGPSSGQPATNFNWAWSDEAIGNSVSQDLSAPSPWAGNSAELAFELSAVPEPVSTSLVGTGLLAGWLLRLKQKSAKG